MIARESRQAWIWPVFWLLSRGSACVKLEVCLRPRVELGVAVMKLSSAYGPGKFGLSFELFPPKTPQGETTLFEHVAKLVEFGPSYITCTYGAGGSTRDTTLGVVSRVHRE